MPTSNGKITAPVAIWDAMKCLGVTSSNVGVICNDINGRVNQMARYKPVRYAKIGELTDAERMNSNAVRIPDGTEAGDPDISKPPYKFGSVAQLVQYSGDYLEWYTNSRPRGGASEPFRLHDFAGYNHKAIYYSFMEAKMDASKVIKYWTIGMKAGQTAATPLQTLYLAIINGNESVEIKFEGVRHDLRYDTALKVNNNYKDSIIWWRQKDIIDNYVPVIIIWKVNDPSKYHCVKGDFITSPYIAPHVTINKSDIAALLNKGEHDYLDDYYDPNDEYNTVKFMFVLFPKSMASFPNGQIQQNCYFIVPPMFKSETGKFSNINVNKALSMWGGKIEVRFLWQFHIQKVYCANNWLTRHDPSALNNGNYETFGYGDFNPDTMIRYEQPYSAGSLTDRFDMFTGYNQSYNSVQNATFNYKFMYDRLVFDAILSNITEDDVQYREFKVTYDGRTEYLAGVVKYNDVLPNGQTSNVVCQEPYDANNLDLGYTMSTLTVKALSRVSLMLDLGFILNSNYTLKNGNYDFIAPALTGGNITNPWVTNPRSGLLQPDITITAKNVGTGERVTIAKFKLNLKFPSAANP